MAMETSISQLSAIFGAPSCTLVRHFLPLVGITEAPNANAIPGIAWKRGKVGLKQQKEWINGMEFVWIYEQINMVLQGNMVFESQLLRGSHSFPIVQN